jgi:hypothetical protein
VGSFAIIRDGPVRKVSVLIAVIFLLVAALLTTIGLRTASADHGFPGCVPGIGIDLNATYQGTNIQATTAAVGDTLEYDINVTVLATQCPVVNATITLELPDGSIVAVASGVSIASNSTASFDNAATYVVDLADAGNLGAGPDQVRARASVSGTAHRGDGTTESVTASANFTTTVLEPVVVEKTVTPTFDRRFPWEITKSVDPAAWNLFDGDTGTSAYTVAVTKGAPIDENFAVIGTISVTNPNSVAVQINSVTDLVDGTGATVNCGVTFPHSLAAGATLNCTYSASGLVGTETANTATVDAQQGTLPLELDGSATVPFTWGDPVNVIDDTVQITDTNPEFGGPISTSTSNTYTYNITFDCEGLTFDAGGHAAFTHDNTAAIVATQTFPTSSASVAVDCYQLNVTKDAIPTFDRTWLWDITKSAEPTSATVMPGESVTVTYNVTVSVVSVVDDNFHVAGTITITNPNPDRDAELTNVSDVVDGTTATVDCGPLPLLVPAGGTLTCTYEADLLDATSLTNTATATQQNFDFDPALIATPSGTTDYSGTAPVTFGDPTNEIDECITVSDTNPNGPQGEIVCAVDAPVTFTYTETFGPFTEADCGLTFTFPNTASSLTNDTQTPDSADATVTIIVECPDEGCTPGFWKQPQHLDSWVATGFSPSQTLESVFDVPDSLGIDNTTLLQALSFKGGSDTLGAAQILLRAGVAALLNAAHPDVNYAFTTAEVIADVNAALASGDRATMLDLATELDEANNAGCPLS